MSRRRVTRGATVTRGLARRRLSRTGCVTFLNMMSEPTESAVNRAAITNMMMPTGMLVFRPVKAAIQPLAEKNHVSLGTL